ncbi:MAG: hypothetical protein K0R11_834, partial [Acidimicrobiales bacterium]|nr:hypothetical protein [Acidimicrobiales bacterium]
MAGDAHGLGPPEVLPPAVVRLEQPRHPRQVGHRPLQLRAGGEEDGGPDLGHRELPQLVGVRHEGVVELAQAPHPQADVGRPRGLVERPAGGGDGRVKIGG